MKITCQNCGQNYRVDEKKIPPGVSSLKCKKCGHRVSLGKVSPGSGNAGQPAANPKPEPERGSEDIVKITCPKCERPYSIRKDKMPEGIPSITCRSCGEAIPINIGDGGYAGKTCKKCGYRRTEQDDALSSPDACPKCGLLYDKTKLYLIKKESWAKEEAEKSNIHIHEDSAPGLRKPMFIGGVCVIAVVALFMGWGLIESLIASLQGDPDADFAMSAELAEANRLPVFIGSTHTAFIHEDGTVRTWGRNRYGQLGDGSVNYRAEPVTAYDLDGIISLSGSSRFTLALRHDGTVWAWGYNVKGQLGDGSGKSRAEPVQVAELSDIVAISGGGSHSMALGRNGRVWTWGENSHGQLGYRGSHVLSPKMVAGIGSVIAISAGATHSVALRNDGTVWSWGSNHKGQLGLGVVSRKTLVPTQAPEFGDVAKIATGGNSTFAIKTDGTVWGWGGNLNGRLGDGSVADRRGPVQVADIEKIVSVAPGENHTLALANDGTVWAWGGNSKGQLGDGSRKVRMNPVRVAGKIRAVYAFAGHNTSLAILGDESVWAWGGNEERQIGDGSTERKVLPYKTTYYEEMVKSAASGLMLSEIKADAQQ